MADEVVIDTSTLINFLRIGRVDLLTGLAAYRFVVTDDVRAEIFSSYPVQYANLDLALKAGHLHVVSLVDPAEGAAFAAMQSLRVLGDGECSAIAAAQSANTSAGLPSKRPIWIGDAIWLRMMLVSGKARARSVSSPICGWSSHASKLMPQPSRSIERAIATSGAAASTQPEMGKQASGQDWTTF